MRGCVCAYVHQESGWACVHGHMATSVDIRLLAPRIPLNPRKEELPLRARTLATMFGAAPRRASRENRASPYKLGHNKKETQTMMPPKFLLAMISYLSLFHTSDPLIVIVTTPLFTQFIQCYIVRSHDGYSVL
jgi:hypothetical protein